MNENNLLSLLIVLLVIGTIFNFLLALAISYLASVIKRRFGKDYADKYIEAAEIGVRGSEQYFLASSSQVANKDKKDLALDITKKMLQKDNIALKTRDDEDLLSDIIEAMVNKVNEHKRPAHTPAGHKAG
ncbi:MAG: phage holin, LLH family [bacterium]|nr:phage holin, LLH family [bacterium]